jgi:hypothetical protein
MLATWRNSRDEGRDVPLYNQVEKFRIFLANGARLLPHYQNGLSILQWAIMVDKDHGCELVRLLCNNQEMQSEIDGVDSICGSPPTTPLVRALTRGYGHMREDNRSDMVKVLISAGADPGSSMDGDSMLFTLVSHMLLIGDRCWHSNLVLKTLLDHMSKKQIQARADTTNSSLVWMTLNSASLCMYTSSILTTLLEHGCDPNAVHGPTGETALYTFLRDVMENDARDSIPRRATLQTLLDNPMLRVTAPNRDGRTIVDLVNEQYESWNIGESIYTSLYQCIERSNNSLRDAFLLASHARLGAKSHANGIDPEVMSMIVDKIPSIRTPDEIFRP